MNKHEIEAKIKELEAAKATLEKQLAELPKGSGLFIVPERDDEYGNIGTYPYRNGFESATYTAGASAVAYTPTTEYAPQLTEALNTFAALQMCDGAEKPVDGKRQWYIDAEGYIDDYYNLVSKMVRFTAWFATQEQAEAARDKIGKERIMRMYGCLHGLCD